MLSKNVQDSDLGRLLANSAEDRMWRFCKKSGSLLVLIRELAYKKNTYHIEILNPLL